MMVVSFTFTLIQAEWDQNDRQQAGGGQGGNEQAGQSSTKVS